MRRRRRIGKLERSLAHAVRSASWIGDADAATVDTARRLAEELDRFYHAREQAPGMFTDPKASAEAVSKTAYGASMLMIYLRELALTPGARGSTVGDDDGPFADVARLVSGPWKPDGIDAAAARDGADS